MIIDIDTHFEPGRAWLADYPSLADRLPEFSVAEATVRAQVGDLLALVPAERRPAMTELLPPGIAAILGEVKVDGYGFEGSAMHTPGDPVERLAWMDRVGIDAANTICLQGADYASTLADRALAREAIETCNTWLADRVDGYQHRLLPLTSIDATDIEWSIAELTRMRARGSRSFLIDTLPAPGYPPMHDELRAPLVGGRGSGDGRLRPRRPCAGILRPGMGQLPRRDGAAPARRQPEQSVGDPHVERHGLRRRVRPPPEAHDRLRRAGHPLVRRGRAAHGVPRPGHPRVGHLHGPLPLRADTCRVRALATCASLRCPAPTSPPSGCSRTTRNA